MKSYWSETAHPAPTLPILATDETCDVVIIGAGLTGLVAALTLLDRGVNALVVEARDIGWGGSGRNGGSATPRYKPGFAELAQTFGEDTARLLHRRLHEGLDAIEANVERFAIDCDFRRCGQVTAAHSLTALAKLEADAAWLKEIGDETPRILNEVETCERLGLEIYRGAYLDMRGASLHPLNYVRGLAAGLSRSGLRIYIGTEVSSVEENSNTVVIRSRSGRRINAKRAILATDAYLGTDLTSTPLRNRFLTVSSSIIATAPLTRDTQQDILPGRHVTADTFTLLNYFQLLADGRLMFGGRGAVTGQEDSPRVYRILEQRMRRLFPRLGSTPVTHRWSGLVGLTNESLPKVVPVGSQTYAALGYAGRGVVPSHLLGRAAAGLAIDSPEDFGPLIGTLMPPIPFHALKRAGMQLAIAYFGLRDRWEARP